MQAPVGRIGARPIGQDQQFQMNIQTQGRLATPEQFGNIVLRANPDGSLLRVRDVARVDLGAQNEDVEGRLQRPAGRGDRDLSVARRQRGDHRFGGRSPRWTA